MIEKMIERIVGKIEVSSVKILEPIVVVRFLEIRGR
jgi:hypothetical protein